jgi:heme o synthase
MADGPPVSSGASYARILQQLRGDLMALTKARLSFLVLVTTVFGYAVAAKDSGTFSFVLLFHLILGTIMCAFGSSVFNQLMESDQDARMPRTADRPLPSQRFPKAAAFVLGWLLCAFGLMHLGAKVNIFAAAMAAATLFSYLFLYTPLKRMSATNTLVGAVSGALPPLIGWTGGGGEILSWDALYLFALLFFWQLPHFAAINWMYREDYVRGGFKMWSNSDPTGRKTARIALGFASALTAVTILFPLLIGLAASWVAVLGGLLGFPMMVFAVIFRCTGTRSSARRLFFYTLLYLPMAMLSIYFGWR